MNIWLIAPGANAKYFKECYENDMIVLGWDSVGDIKKYASVDSIKTALQEKDPEYKDKNPSQAAKMLWDFGHKVEAGDLVIARDGLTKLVGVGILGDYIPADYESNPSKIEEHHQVREVTWLNDRVKEVPFQLSRNTIVSLNTLDEEKQDTIKELIKITEDDNDKLAKYVIYGSDNNEQAEKLKNILNQYPIDEDYEEIIKKYIELAELGAKIYQYQEDMGEWGLIEDIAYGIFEDDSNIYPNLWEALVEYAYLDEGESLTEYEQIEEVNMCLFDEVFEIGKKDYIDEQLEFLWKICEDEGC